MKRCTATMTVCFSILLLSGLTARGDIFQFNVHLSGDQEVPMGSGDPMDLAWRFSLSTLTR